MPSFEQWFRRNCDDLIGKLALAYFYCCFCCIHGSFSNFEEAMDKGQNNIDYLVGQVVASATAG